MRRLEREHLSFFGERLLDLHERRAASGRENELAGRVLDNARMVRDVEHGGLGRTANERLAVAADDAERLTSSAR